MLIFDHRLPSWVDRANKYPSGIGPGDHDRNNGSSGTISGNLTDFNTTPSVIHKLGVTRALSLTPGEVGEIGSGSVAQTLKCSFSAVSKAVFARQYSSNTFCGILNIMSSTRLAHFCTDRLLPISSRRVVNTLRKLDSM